MMYCIPCACIHQLAVYERLYNSLKALGIKNKLVHKCYWYVCIDQQLSYIPLYILYVTGYWKTDHNVTLGQLHFIGPANSHTHALSMHCRITGLS